MKKYFNNSPNFIKATYCFVILLYAVFISACARSGVSFMKYNSNIYPPTDSIEVLRNKPVEKDYVEIGELSLEVNSGDENSVLLLIDKAKKIGADAIILLGESSDGEITIPIKNLYTGQTMFYSTLENKYLKAIAIRYK